MTAQVQEKESNRKLRREKELHVPKRERTGPDLKTDNTRLEWKTKKARVL